MTDRLEPPSRFAERLFEAERARPGIDAAQAARILARVGVTVGAAAVVGATAGSAAAGASAASHAGAAAKLGLTAKAAPWIAVAFLAGGGTGAAVHAVATRAEPAPVVPWQPASSATVRALAPADAPELPALELPALEPSVLPSAIPGVPPRAIASRVEAAAASSDTGLAGERALIDRARMALARGQARSALEALETHRAEFPRGRLGEEREALSIQALAALGRSTEALRRAEAFERSHPNSVFLPAIELATAATRKIDGGP